MFCSWSCDIGVTFRILKLIRQFKDFTIEYIGEVAKLVINDAYIDDTGDYNCEAWNEIGQQTEKFKLTIKGTTVRKTVATSKIEFFITVFV